jgi:hypothetical protein
MKGACVAEKNFDLKILVCASAVYSTILKALH